MGYVTFQGRPWNTPLYVWCVSVTHSRTNLRIWHNSLISVTWLVHMYDTTHTYEGALHAACETLRYVYDVCHLTHSHVWQGSFINMTRLTHTCDVTRSHVWHDSYAWGCLARHPWHTTIHMSHVWHDSYAWGCLTRHPWHTTIHMYNVCHMTHLHMREERTHLHTWHDSFIREIRFVDMCVWHDPFVRVTWLIYMYDTSVCITCVTWLIHICERTHLHMWHDSFTCATRLIHTRDITRSYVWHDSYYSAAPEILLWGGFG